jgi:YtxH-like protein
MNKPLLRSLLRGGLFFLDFSDFVGKTTDKVGRRARAVVRSDKSSALRNGLSFAGGAALGVGLAILFAPASGEQIRNTIAGRAAEMRDRVREQFSSLGKKPPASATSSPGLDQREGI